MIVHSDEVTINGFKKLMIVEEKANSSLMLSVPEVNVVEF